MLRFRSLGSGSGGNATLVQALGLVPFRMLIDCGLGIRQLSLRLGEAGIEPEDIQAIFDGAAKLGILTDLGHATPHVIAHLQGCDALLLECNHDTELLSQSVYPEFLKRRVGGPYGHLSNQAAADIACAVTHSGLTHLIAAHLSAQNNRPDLVQSVMSKALGCNSSDIVVARASSGTPWLQV